MTPHQYKSNARGGLATYANATTVCAIVALFFSLTSVSHGQDLQAEKVFGWDFQRGDDRNADQEADGWRRRRDRQHPAYIDIKIVSKDEQRAQAAMGEQLLAARALHALKVGRWDWNYIPEIVPRELAEIMDRHVLDNCLEIRMDGGAAELVSPKFPMDPRFSYSLDADVSCQGLAGHKAWIELQLLDQAEEELSSMRTPAVSHTTPWTSTSTGITSDVSPDLKWGRVHLKVEPKGQVLITGLARFDSINIHRLPRLSLTADLPQHIAEVGEAFEVGCLAMGINGKFSSVKFELRDYRHQLISGESVSLSEAHHFRTGEAKAGVPHYVSSVRKPSVAVSPNTASEATPAVAGSDVIQDGVATWKLQLFEPGLYRVRVDLGIGGLAQTREILIGVMPASDPVKAGPFGWSIKTFDRGLLPEDVPLFVQRFGAGWLKFPVWFEASDIATADRLVAMTERVQTLGSECVGRFDQPPATQRPAFGEGDELLPAVSIFRDPTVWESALEPVLTRMGLKLDWFQLGSDDDRSFMGVSDLSNVVTDIRARMQTYSQELKLTINWTWLDDLDETSAAPWNAVQFGTTPQLTATELLIHAKANSGGRVARWVSLDPLPASRYELLDRVRDLAERMIAIKQTKIDAAFVSDPFDEDRGLFDGNQNIGELLIPWTSLVSALGESQYMGSIELPGNSVNHVFRNGAEGIMLLWNDSPQQEQQYFGEDISATDVWGKSIETVAAKSSRGLAEQRIEVDSWPIIVRGIDVDVIRWRQKFQVAVSNLASSLEKGQTLPLTIENTFSQTATGQIFLTSESLLRNGNASMQLQLTRGNTHSREMPISIRPDASAGMHELRFDFDILADKRYNFSVFRSVVLGLGDIEFHWDVTHHSANKVTLRVELINNTTETADFDCKFFPLGQPYQRFQILDARPGSTMREFNLNLSREHEASEAWIRCEEIGTGRVLNYRLAL